MMILSVLLTVVLGLLAAIHALWGFGIWVPIRDEETLTHAVVGARGATRMPGPIPCFLVVAGLCAVIASLWVPDLTVPRILLWLAVAVFLGRGVMAYSRFWRRMAPVEPFATNDRRYYGPLSLGLGIGLILILLGGG